MAHIFLAKVDLHWNGLLHKNKPKNNEMCFVLEVIFVNISVGKNSHFCLPSCSNRLIVRRINVGIDRHYHCYCRKMIALYSKEMSPTFSHAGISLATL